VYLIPFPNLAGLNPPICGSQSDRAAYQGKVSLALDVSSVEVVLLQVNDSDLSSIFMPKKDC
jgi:hypothetical protein